MAVLADVIKKLREEGFEDANYARIHYAIRAGHIDRPPLSGSLSFEFAARHVNQLRKYLASPRKRGPKGRTLAKS